MSLGTLGGNIATRARLQVPAWGRWWADVDLAEPEALSGAQALVVADQTCQGSIVSGGAVNGRAAYRLVGGAAGWGKTLPAKPYNDDAGVRLRTVLGDAARAVGEMLGTVPDTRLGPHYARPAGPAFELLNALAPRGWYVDFAGVTQIGQRPSAAYEGIAPRVRVDPAAQVIELATDTLAGLVPGVTIDGSEPATDVEIELTPDRLTARVYAAASGHSQRLQAWADLLAALDPRARYRAAYEFRVVTQSGDRLNLQPVRVASGLPDLANVPVRLAPGVKAQHLLGSLVMVAFADADPSRPFVFAGDAADAPGWMPLELDLGGPGALPVAYQTSPVQAGPFAGTVVLGSTLAKVRP